MSDKTPESMSNFFTARLEGYEDHMLTQIGQAMYEKVADMVPPDTKYLLDLGCGTGLELDFIFNRLPDITITGIDMTQSMLDKLAERHSNRDIRMLCGNYFDIAFGEKTFDCIVSVQTMHHFLWEDKVRLYKKILKALKTGGVYIEADFIVEEQASEDEYRARYESISNGNNIRCGELFHIDIPFTTKHQIAMLIEAGFRDVEPVFREGNSAILKTFQR